MEMETKTAFKRGVDLDICADKVNREGSANKIMTALGRIFKTHHFCTAAATWIVYPSTSEATDTYYLSSLRREYLVVDTDCR